VCEGKETEINYFKLFGHGTAGQYCADPIQAQGGRAFGAPRQRLGEAVLLAKGWDTIWCVFDRDSNTNEMLSNAEKYAAAAKYGIAFSNPCFEYWFLLNYIDHVGYIGDAAEALRLLREPGRLENYEKAHDVFAALFGSQDAAIQRASSVSRSLERRDRGIEQRQQSLHNRVPAGGVLDAPESVILKKHRQGGK
jgi:hypothetical protein